MNALGSISTDPALLDVELPRTLIESPSVSTFLPEEEASICPLLSNTNGTSTPLTFSHPLTPGGVDNDSSASANLCNEDPNKGDTSSTSGSSSGIGMDADTAATTLFNKHSYQHLQINNNAVQDLNGHGPNGNLALSNDTPSFVSWNWPLIRKCTFYAFMSSLFAMCAIVVALIVMLPRICNPKTAWYRGSVFYEVFPASFQDSNNDGLGDFRGIGNRVTYLRSLGVSAVRLNSIYASPHYPEDFTNISSLTEIASVLGTVQDLRQLAITLHANNISLILDLPINGVVKELGQAVLPVVTANGLNASMEPPLSHPSHPPHITVSENLISEALAKWTAVGVDGFYIKGLERFSNHSDLLTNLAAWKHIVGSNRVLIISESLLTGLAPSKRALILSYVDLVDVHLDVLNGAKQLETRIKSVLKSDLAPTEDGVWIHWSVDGVERERIARETHTPNSTLAAITMQLLLPGTPSIFYGDEIGLTAAVDPHQEHNLHHLPTMQWFNTTFQFTDPKTLPWLPQTASYSFEHFTTVARMIALRDRSPSIYKNAICKMETTLQNTQIRRSNDDILVVERVYPRRNSFVSVSNFGQKHAALDMTSMYYSGVVMLHDDMEKVYFGNFEIGPFETIVVKLDK